MKKLLIIFGCLTAIIISYKVVSAINYEGDDMLSAMPISVKPPISNQICYPCVPIGSNKTVSGSGPNGCNKVTLGATSACNGTGWVDGGKACTSCSCSNVTYSWAPSAHLNCTTCQNPTYTPNCDGSDTGVHTLTLTVSSSSCGTNSATMTVTDNGCCFCCRIGHFDAPQQDVEHTGMNIFPNPSTGKITVQLDAVNENMSIEVYGIDGKLVMKKTNLTTGKSEIDLSNKAKGMYYIQVLEGNNGILNKKVLIQ